MQPPLASTSRALFRAVKPQARLFTSSAVRSNDTPTSAVPTSSLPEAYRAAPSTSTTSRFTPTARPTSPPSRAYKREAENLYQLHVFSSRNNTILTLSTSGTSPDAREAARLNSQGLSAQQPNGVVAWISAGAAGYKGASRGTFDAAVEVSLRMFKKIADLIDPPVGVGGQRKKVAFPPPSEIELIFKGFGQGRDAVFRTLVGGEGEAIKARVKKVTDATPLKVGGTRAKKRRVI